MHFPRLNYLSGSRNVWVCYSNSRRWSILVYLPSFLECLHQIKAERIQCGGTFVVAEGRWKIEYKVARIIVEPAPSFLSHSLLNLNLYVAGPFSVDRSNGEIAGIIVPMMDDYPYWFQSMIVSCRFQNLKTFTPYNRLLR